MHDHVKHAKQKGLMKVCSDDRLYLIEADNKMPTQRINTNKRLVQEIVFLVFHRCLNDKQKLILVVIKDLASAHTDQL